MTIAAWTLAALLHLAPWMAAREAHLAELADAVSEASLTREDAALLVSIAWWETGRSLELGLVGDRGHSVSPWQIWGCGVGRPEHCRSLKTDLRYAAREAIWQARASIRECRGLAEEDRLAQYTTGRCVPNREARLRWRTARRLLEEVPLAPEEAPDA